jgi:hypothetical protein
VVIIRHILADGTTFLSFYGHLDPPSVTLQQGDCVQRGQQVGNIGRPRSSPHLHFEIRTHLPYIPGPGYWTEDPRLAGWLPPSQTIWQQRMAFSPGVAWTRPFTQPVQSIGPLQEGTYTLLDGRQLQSISLADGRLTTLLPDIDVDQALISADQTRLYTADRQGHLTAYQLPELTPLWELDLDNSGLPQLWALPGGGVVVSLWENLFGVDGDGRLLWHQNLGGRPFAWAVNDEQLILTTAGANHATWFIGQSYPPLRSTALTGYPLVSGDRIWLYAEDGLYQLDPTRATPELLYALPPAYLLQSHLTALPDGGVMLAQFDRDDQRLIALQADGAVRWERSYRALAADEIQLVTNGDQVYLIVAAGSGSVQTLSLYGVDLATAELTLLFQGGTRSALPTGNWVTAADNGRLLINIGGGHMLVLDPAEAQQALAELAE